MADDDESPVPDSYHYCQAFRRLARRALALQAPKEGQHLSDQQDRAKLLEDLWELGDGTDVWAAGIAQGVCMALLYVYDGDGKEAAEIMNHLADEELRHLRGAKEEEGEEGTG